MARPSITGPTITVSIDDDLLIWTDGLLSGTNKDYIDKAHHLSNISMPVDLTPFGPTIIANLYNPDAPEQALAAMFGVLNGRAKVLDAPKELLDLFPFESNQEV